MAADEGQMGDLPFPLQGISLTHAFSYQLPMTTRAGINVRAYEPGSERARGGSRQGLARYILPQLPTAAVIQHLNYVVDPSADAILANFGEDPTPNVPPINGTVDPSENPPGSNPANPTDYTVRNRGNIVRTGGSGIQPNRNVKIVINNPYSGTVSADPPSAPNDGTTSTITITVNDRYNFPSQGDSIVLSTNPAGRVGDGGTGTTDGFGQAEFTVSDTMSETVNYICTDLTHSTASGSASVNWGQMWKHVQSTLVQSNFTLAPTFTASYPTQVTQNNLLVAVINVEFPGFTAVNSITDSQGNSWSNISPGDNQRSIWIALAGATNGNIVTVHCTNGFGMQYIAAILEYSGNATVSPIDSISGNISNINASPFTVGPTTISSSNGMILAAFFQNTGNMGTATISAGGVYTLRQAGYFEDTPPSTGNNYSLAVMDHLNINTTEASTATPSFAVPYVALAVSFNPS